MMRLGFSFSANVAASDAVKLVYTHAGTNPQALGSATVANSDAKQISLTA